MEFFFNQMGQVGGGMHGGRIRYPKPNQTTQQINRSIRTSIEKLTNKLNRGLDRLRFKVRRKENDALLRAGMTNAALRRASIIAVDHLASEGLQYGLGYLTRSGDSLVDDFLKRASRRGITNYSRMSRREQSKRRKIIYRRVLANYRIMKRS
tara:strand:+ start:60 stop:515 length:456 start_codon:yes stop_codon:yes gene_type:complete